jgi:hypothetical protein
MEGEPQRDPYTWAAQWQEVPAPGEKQPSSPSAAAEPTLVTIGDIAVSRLWVATPSGTSPLSSAVFTVTDVTQISEGIPTWAIVCAIVFAIFCLLGLLFLLVKERKVTGYVQVTVQGDRLVHVCSIPVSDSHQIADINARVNYARYVAAAYRPPTGQQ